MLASLSKAQNTHSISLNGVQDSPITKSTLYRRQENTKPPKNGDAPVNPPKEKDPPKTQPVQNNDQQPKDVKKPNDQPKEEKQPKDLEQNKPKAEKEPGDLPKNAQPKDIPKNKDPKQPVDAKNPKGGQPKDIPKGKDLKQPEDAKNPKGGVLPIIPPKNGKDPKQQPEVKDPKDNPQQPKDGELQNDQPKVKDPKQQEDAKNPKDGQPKGKDLDAKNPVGVLPIISPKNGKDPKQQPEVKDPEDNPQQPKDGEPQNDQPKDVSNPGGNLPKNGEPQNGQPKGEGPKQPDNAKNPGGDPPKNQPKDQPPPTVSNPPAPAPTNDDPPNPDNKNDNNDDDNNDNNDDDNNDNNDDDNNDNNDDDNNEDDNDDDDNKKNGNKDNDNGRKSKEQKKPFIPPKSVSISLIPTPVAKTTTSIPTNIPAKIVVDEDDSYEAPPPDTSQVQLKFSAQLPWLQVVNSPVLPSQFVDFVKQDISTYAGINITQIAVKDLQVADDGGVLMTMNIPENKLDKFYSTITNPNSAFYSDGSVLSKLVDPTFQAVTQNDGTTKPTNLVLNGGNNSNKGLIIGFAVAGSTILYAGLTALVIRVYKKNRLRRQENHGLTNG